MLTTIPITRSSVNIGMNLFFSRSLFSTPAGLSCLIILLILNIVAYLEGERGQKRVPRKIYGFSGCLKEDEVDKHLPNLVATPDDVRPGAVQVCLNANMMALQLLAHERQHSFHGSVEVYWRHLPLL